ncbi:hypothetical protein EV122DRAFT_282820 [Schizophyllum commune]
MDWHCLLRCLPPRLEPERLNLDGIWLGSDEWRDPSGDFFPKQLRKLTLRGMEVADRSRLPASSASWNTRRAARIRVAQLGYASRTMDDKLFLTSDRLQRLTTSFPRACVLFYRLDIISLGSLRDISSLGSLRDIGSLRSLRGLNIIAAASSASSRPRIDRRRAGHGCGGPSSWAWLRRTLKLGMVAADPRARIVYETIRAHTPPAAVLHAYPATVPPVYRRRETGRVGAAPDGRVPGQQEIWTSNWPTGDLDEYLTNSSAKFECVDIHLDPQRDRKIACNLPSRSLGTSFQNRLQPPSSVGGALQR